MPTLILLESGDHVLSTSIELYERNIKFEGTSLHTRIFCAPDTGLLFINSIHPSISNLIIENCPINYFSTHHVVSSAVFISGY